MLVYKWLRYVKKFGFVAAMKQTKKVVVKAIKRRFVNDYSKKDLKRQKETQFPLDIKFSILVPLYNTPKKYLHEMIRSVQMQTYGNWELCLADGSDAEHVYVEQICNRYSKKENRIKYRKLEKNLGISANLNVCIEMARGEYLALLDHDDLLHPAALYENMRVICEKDADFIYTDEKVFCKRPRDAYLLQFKPDYAPDMLRSYNYICHFTVFKKALLDRIGGGFRAGFDGSQDYDLILRLTEKAEKIVHIPRILYYWRRSQDTLLSEHAIISAKAALEEHLDRIEQKGKVTLSSAPKTYRIEYQIKGEPKISILIPNKDHIEDLRKCIDSIRERSKYRNWEILIIENNSTKKETFEYYDELKKDGRIRVIVWDGIFNYSAINNFATKEAMGEYYLLLNNDVEIITPDWIEQMLMFAQRKDVGAVGCMLYYPDDTIQHAGVVIGIGGVAAHGHRHFKRNDYGYMNRLTIVQNYSAVTAACLMLSRDVYQSLNGFDEEFEVDFNDVDLCMRIREKELLIVWTPYAELYHYESKSRGDKDTPEKKNRFNREVERFQKRWKKALSDGDPYYNPNLAMDREDFTIR